MEEKLRSFKIKESSYNKVKKVKFKLGTPISFFIEEAIDEKLERLPKKDKDKLNK